MTFQKTDPIVRKVRKFTGGTEHNLAPKQSSTYSLDTQQNFLTVLALQVV